MSTPRSPHSAHLRSDVELLEDRVNPGFLGGVSVAAGDWDGDDFQDIATGAGAGGGPHVKVYSGQTGGELAGWYAYDVAFIGGVSVAMADATGDGVDDLITGAGPGGGPHVKVFDGVTRGVAFSVFAFDPAFLGGVSVTAADLDGDGRADIATGVGPGGGPHVKAFSGASGIQLLGEFTYAPAFRGGVRVAAADTDGDGVAELITGAGPGGGTHVKVFDCSAWVEESSYFATTPSDTSGVRVLGADIDQDGRAEVLTVSGDELLTFDGASGTAVDRSPLSRADFRAEFCSCPATPEADAVTDWNREVLRAVRDARLAPPVVSRVLAVTHLAMFDAANALTGGYSPHLSGLPTAPDRASAELSAAAAAHRVLSALLPAHQPRWDRLTAGWQLADEGVRSASVSFGQAVGERHVVARANDGSATPTPHTPGSMAGAWVPTPSAFAPALLPGWGNVTPFALSSGGQFAPPPPPPLTSVEYAAAFEAVRSLGAKRSPARTPDQTQVALFWADGAGTVTPPGHWNVILQGLASRDGRSVTDHARAFALLNAALADAAITSWHAKYRDQLWRPVTAVRRADEDGHPATAADPAWEPLLATPPFPAYTSGHSTFSAAAAEVLTALYGAADFHTSSDALPDVRRRFSTFRAAADEAGMSRIFGGIHFGFDNTAGLNSGREVGVWVTDHLLTPVSAS